MDGTREELLHSLSVNITINIFYLFKHIVPIISFISFHGILSLDYPYIIATSGYINLQNAYIYIYIYILLVLGSLLMCCQGYRRHV